MSCSSFEVHHSARSANAPADAQAALITSRFARSSGEGLSSADSISADWCVNSSDKSLMCVNAIAISLIRPSMLSLEMALGVCEAPATRCRLRGSVMGAVSRGCNAGFVRRSWRPDVWCIRSPHFTPRLKELCCAPVDPKMRGDIRSEMARRASSRDAKAHGANPVHSLRG